MDLAVQREKESNGVFCDRIGRILGHAGHGDAGIAGCRKIDVVESGTAQGDKPGPLPRESLENVFLELIIDERAEGLAAFRGDCRLQGQAGFEIDELVCQSLVGRSQELFVIWRRSPLGDPAPFRWRLHAD